MSSVYGFDNLYSESVNDIALLNYNRGVANRLKNQEMEMHAHLPFKEPKLLTGGVRASSTIQPGSVIDGVPRAVGGRAFRKFTGDEKPSEGGSRIKKAYKWKAFANETADDALGLAKKVISGGSLVYSPSLKKALKDNGPYKTMAVGGAKPKTGRFVKGSAEAKAHMAKIRAMKKK